MNLSSWFEKWGISETAQDELKKIFHTISELNLSKNTEGDSETAVKNAIRLEAAQHGVWLFRNNVGATYAKNGSFLRYGLANDSEALNKVLKSSDLIGVKPVKITHSLMGKTIGQFVSREVKHSTWKYSSTPREKAQLKWLELISSLGGDACFVTQPGSFL